MSSALKKHLKKKRDNAVKGLSKEDIEIYDAIESARLEFDSMVDSLVNKIFPEILDFTQDSFVDSAMRKSGASPMSDEYNAKIDAKMKRLGVDSSYGSMREYCEKLILKKNEFIAEKK